MTDATTAQAPTTLTWSADLGNDLVYSTNSNVPLHLYVGQAFNANAPQGNIIIKTSRGGDTVTPMQATVGDGDLQVQLRVKDAGTASVSATLGSLSAKLDVQVSAPDPSQTTLVFEPNTIVAGEQAAVGTLWAKDSQGRSISGVGITAASVERSTTILPDTVVSHATGRAVFSVQGYSVGAHTVTVTGEGVSFTQTLTVTPAGVDARNSSITFTPASVRANGIDKTTVLVQVRDANNNPIPGLAVTLTASSVDSTLEVASGVTDDAGNFQSGLRCTVAKVVSVLAQVRPKQSSPVSLRGSTVFNTP